jgi:hypothetical protein
MSKLRKSLRKFDSELQKKSYEISAFVGILKNGKKTIEVPNRPSYVYVRLRTNLDEVVEAFNENVSLAYNLPVIIRREGNSYVVDRRDIERYEDWQQSVNYTPKHGKSHSYNKDQGIFGSDPAWIYSYQFMPSLVTPMGQVGAENVYIYPYPILHEGSWKYAGNTGTPSLLNYKNASGTVIVLITLDSESGNPYLIATSGTYIPSSASGVHSLLPYIPAFDTSQYLPLSFITVTSGTNQITWANIYDIRQLAGAVQTTQGSINHNNLLGLQGGGSGTYYHLSAPEHQGLVGGEVTTLHSHSGTYRDIIMETGVTFPPVPLTNNEGTDWIYSS